MPRLSPGMNEASVSRWLKKAGDEVRQGEALFEVETEKVATEVTAPASGVLQIVVPENHTVAIGTLVGLIGAAGEVAAAGPAAPGTGGAGQANLAAPTASAAGAGATAAPASVPAAAPAAPATASPEPRAAAPAANRQDQSAGTPGADVGRVVASPAARRLGRELGVELAGLRGSGPGGRIIERDVERAAAAAAAAPTQPAVPAPAAAAPAATPVSAGAGGGRPLAGIRKVIADRMLQSQSTNATVTLTLEVDMHEATNLRQQLIGEWEKREGVRVTFTDILVKAVAKALTEHPRLNASLVGDRIVEHDAVNIGVAVALDDGLIVPVIRDAARKTILEIGRASRDLGERARSNRVSVGEVTGSTFTITNLGTAGVDAFTPIINPPECAILGVGKIAPKPVARDGQVVIRPLMWLSLTFDHRIVDGHPAALFLGRIQQILERPYLLFV